MKDKATANRRTSDGCYGRFYRSILEGHSKVILCQQHLSAHHHKITGNSSKKLQYVTPRLAILQNITGQKKNLMYFSTCCESCKQSTKTVRPWWRAEFSRQKTVVSLQIAKTEEAIQWGEHSCALWWTPTINLKWKCTFWSNKTILTHF